MINVKVVDSKEKTYPKDLQACKYYSCKSKKLHDRGVFIIVPDELIDNELVQTCSHPQNSNVCGRCGMNNCTRPVWGSDNQTVIWLNSKYNNQGLGYDVYRDLIECNYDFQEVKNAELTFYV